MSTMDVGSDQLSSAERVVHRQNQVHNSSREVEPTGLIARPTSRLARPTSR